MSITIFSPSPTLSVNHKVTSILLNTFRPRISGVYTDIDTIHLLTDDSDSNNVQPTFTSEEDITELGDPLQHNERYDASVFNFMMFDHCLCRSRTEKISTTPT